MSTPGKPQEDKDKGNEQKNAVIEVKISIPPLFGGNIGSILQDFGKAAMEVARAGRAMVGSAPDGEESPKMRKIEIK